MAIRLNQSDIHRQARRLLQDGKASVTSIKLDGSEVSVKAAKAALREDIHLGPAVSSFAKTVEEKEQWIKERTLQIPFGREIAIGEVVLKFMNAAPEEYYSGVQKLELARSDGTKLVVDVEVLDFKATALMKRVSSVINSGSALPFVGAAIGFGSSLLSGFAAVAAHSLGRPRLANALFSMTRRHVTLSVATLAPIVGSVACLLFAARDARDADLLSRMPTVAKVVQLSSKDVAKLPFDVDSKWVNTFNKELD